MKLCYRALAVQAFDLGCPFCRALHGQPCRTREGVVTRWHAQRLESAKQHFSYGHDGVVTCSCDAGSAPGQGLRAVCAWCGGGMPVPARWQGGGRTKRYCGGRCRTAAFRASGPSRPRY